MDLLLHVVHVVASAADGDGREGNLCDGLGRVLQRGHHLLLLPLGPRVQGEVGGQDEEGDHHHQPEHSLQGAKLVVEDVAHAMD